MPYFVFLTCEGSRIIHEELSAQSIQQGMIEHWSDRVHIGWDGRVGRYVVCVDGTRIVKKTLTSARTIARAARRRTQGPCIAKS